MRSPFRTTGRGITAALLFALAACGPPDVGADRLDGVDAGDARADLLETLGTGPLVATGADTLRLVNGYRRQSYFASGATYEVIWYRSEPGSLADQIIRDRETPILLTNDTVMGWGWSFYDAKARELGLPNPMRDQERLDSISRSQQAGAGGG
jgi:hypothetical protein